MSEMATQELRNEIKQLIIDCLVLPDITTDDIEDNASLLDGSGTLKLDSVDALEIVMAIEDKYKVRIDNQNLARTVVQCVDSIAEFVATNGK